MRSGAAESICNAYDIRLWVFCRKYHAAEVFPTGDGPRSARTHLSGRAGSVTLPRLRLRPPRLAWAVPGVRGRRFRYRLRMYRRLLKLLTVLSLPPR